MATAYQRPQPQQPLLSFGGLMERLSREMQADIERAGITEYEPPPVPVHKKGQESRRLDFKNLPLSARLNKKLDESPPPQPSSSTDSIESMFGVLIRGDRPSPAHPTRKRAPRFGVEDLDFECNRCGATKTPERRMGPNGRRTLCNKCGLRWVREEKERKKPCSTKRKRASNIIQQ